MVACLGCGDDISTRKSDRRSLRASSSAAIVQEWKRRTTHVTESSQPEAETDTLKSSIDNLLVQDSTMCRRCYSAYERCITLNTQINNRLLTAIRKLFPNSPTLLPTSTVAEVHLGTTSSRKRPPNPTNQTPPRPSKIFRQSTPRTPHQKRFQSPKNVVVYVGYKSPKKYKMTPRRKRMVKAIARRSTQSVAMECLTNEATKESLWKLLTQQLRNEIKCMSSLRVNSILRNKSMEALRSFSWKVVIEELRTNAPILLGVLNACTKTRKTRFNRDGVLGMCACMLLNLHSQKMNLAQRILSIILHCGHSAKQVYERLHTLRLVTSHKTCTRLVSEMGRNHDEEVIKWKDYLTDSLGRDSQISNDMHINGGAVKSDSDEDMSLNISDFSSLGSEDMSFQSEEGMDETHTSMDGTGSIEGLEDEVMSEIDFRDCSSVDDSDADDEDSENENEQNSQTGSDKEEECETGTDEESSCLTEDETDCETARDKDTECESTSGLETDEYLNATNSSGNTCSEGYAVYTFSLCGDNINWGIQARYMRIEKGKSSLNYFHSYAVLDRICVNHLPDTLPPTCQNNPHIVAHSLLPSMEDDKILHKDFEVLISRVLATHFKFFKFSCSDIVQWHIGHQFSAEMSRKSTVVPLGVMLKDENKKEDMVDIMYHHHHYVPTLDITDDTLPTVMSAEMSSSGSKYQPSNQVKMHSLLIGGDQLTAARGRSSKKHMSNAPTPSQRLEGLTPVAEDWHTKALLLEVIWKLAYSDKSSSEQSTLYQLRNAINRRDVVKKPVSNFNACDDFFMTILTSHIIAAAMHVLKVDKLDEIPPDDVIQEASTLWMQPKNGRKKELQRVCNKIVTKFVSFRFHQFSDKNTSQNKQDNIFNYASNLLGIGLFYWEFCDAIREGDGNRVLRCWRYMLPMFINTGRKNYSLEALNMLMQHDISLPPRQATQLLYSRFINTQGLPGRNIPADLHMEHLNRIVKDSVRDLGSNKTQSAIQRVGRALGTIVPVIECFDSDNSVAKISGKHSRASADKDISIVVRILKQSDIFQATPGRKHKSFPNPKDGLRENKKTK